MLTRWSVIEVVLFVGLATSGRLAKVSCAPTRASGFAWRSNDPERHYWSYDTLSNFENATTSCKKDGGKLLIVEDPMARDYISGVVWKTFWLGLYRNAAGNMQWSDSSPLGSPAWGVGEPRSRAENCMSLSVGDRFPGRVEVKSSTALFLQSSDCGTYRPFVCTLATRNPPWATSSAPHPTDPNSYLVFAEGLWVTWQDAASFCAASNGTLATVNSDALLSALYSHLVPLMTYLVGSQPFNVTAMAPAVGTTRVENGVVVQDLVPGEGQSAAARARVQQACTLWDRVNDAFHIDPDCPDASQFLCYSDDQDMSPMEASMGAKTLLFFSYRATFQFAQETCTAHNASLLTVDSATENSLLQALVAKYARGQSLFIGAYGSNTSIHGTPLLYSNFLAFPPAFDVKPYWSKDGCVAVSHWDASTGHFWPGAWWPISCLQARPFVCSKGDQMASPLPAAPKTALPDSRTSSSLLGMAPTAFIAMVAIFGVAALLAAFLLCLYLRRHRPPPASEKAAPYEPFDKLPHSGHRTPPSPALPTHKPHPPPPDAASLPWRHGRRSSSNSFAGQPILGPGERRGGWGVGASQILSLLGWHPKHRSTPPPTTTVELPLEVSRKTGPALSASALCVQSSSSTISHVLKPFPATATLAWDHTSLPPYPSHRHLASTPNIPYPAPPTHHPRSHSCSQIPTPEPPRPHTLHPRWPSDPQLPTNAPHPPQPPPFPLATTHSWAFTPTPSPSLLDHPTPTDPPYPPPDPRALFTWHINSLALVTDSDSDWGGSPRAAGVQRAVPPPARSTPDYWSTSSSDNLSEFTREDGATPSHPHALPPFGVAFTHSVPWDIAPGLDPTNPYSHLPLARSEMHHRMSLPSVPPRGGGRSATSTHQDIFDNPLPSPSFHIADAAAITIHNDCKLGQGACGTVYRGEYRNTCVAVKVIDVDQIGTGKDDADQDRVLASYRQEIAVLSRIDHPNILRMYGACVDPPKFLVVEELMHKSLAAHIHDSPFGRLPLGEALRVGGAVAAGLEHLHPIVVHRDLKPQNVLLSESGEVKIGDFGAARIKIDTYLTESANMAGTVPYMAPECLRCDNGVSEKCDIYSLGVILWEAVTGLKPWAGERAVGIIYRVALQGHRLLVPPACPAPVAALITRCLDFNPSLRPHAEEVVSRIDGMLAELGAATLAAPVVVVGAPAHSGEVAAVHPRHAIPTLPSPAAAGKSRQQHPQRTPGRRKASGASPSRRAAPQSLQHLQQQTGVGAC